MTEDEEIAQNMELLENLELLRAEDSWNIIQDLTVLEKEDGETPTEEKKQ